MPFRHRVQPTFVFAILATFLLCGAATAALTPASLTLTDTSFLPRPWEMTAKCDLATADFVYVRWLGNRKDIEKQTATWDKTVVDRTEDLANWVHLFRQFMKRDLKVYAYANNHYAGNGPNTVKLFWDTWKR